MYVLSLPGHVARALCTSMQHCYATQLHMPRRPRSEYLSAASFRLSAQLAHLSDDPAHTHLGSSPPRTTPAAAICTDRVPRIRCVRGNPARAGHVHVSAAACLPPLGWCVAPDHSRTWSTDLACTMPMQCMPLSTYIVTPVTEFDMPETKNAAVAPTSSEVRSFAKGALATQ